jgi:hypothetical protein
MPEISLVPLHNSYLSNVVQTHVVQQNMCAVMYFNDDLVIVIDPVSNHRNGQDLFPVYSSQSIVGWNTNLFVRKWEMLAPSIAQIAFVELRHRFLEQQALYHTIPQDSAKSSLFRVN